MSDLAQIERRLERIEALLVELTGRHAHGDVLAGVGSDARRLIELARVSPEAAKDEAKRLAAADNQSRRKAA